MSKTIIISAVISLIVFRFISKIPLPHSFLIEIFAILLGGCFILVRYIVKPVMGRTYAIAGFDLYVLLLLFMPLYSGVRAYAVYGQPMIYGIFSQSAIWLLSLVLILLHLIRVGVLEPDKIQKSLLGLAWIFVFCFCVLTSVLDPAQFAENYPTFATPYEFKFEPILTIFAFFVYYFRGMRDKKSFDILLALVLILFLVFVFGKRSLILAMALAIIIVTWSSFSLVRFISIFFRILCAIGLGVLLVGYISPEFLSATSYNWLASINVVTTGEAGGDASSNARLTQIALALPHLKEYWLLGGGDLSNQWYGGYERVLGYFYPSDIGVLGGLYVYGVLGVLLYYVQIIFLAKRPTNMTSNNTVIWLACYGVVLALLLQSVIKGGLFFAPALTLFFIAVMEGIRATNKS